MLVHKREAAILRKALSQWLEARQIDAATAEKLEGSLQVIGFDWRLLGKYAFLLSIICLLTALAALVHDDALRKLLAVLFNAPPLAKALSLFAAAAAVFALAWRKRQGHPEKTFSNEAVCFLGVLAVAGGVFQLMEALETPERPLPWLILLSSLVYGLIGYAFPSGLVWFFALLTLGGWLGAETGYVSGWGEYYLGMNYPLRFTLFGGLLTAAALTLERWRGFRPLRRVSLVMGLLYLFISLWLLSIFGNHGDMGEWEKVKQIELFHWSLLFALVAAWAIWHGLRHDNATLKGFGLTFLMINCYTRYFEYFWDALNKVVFFAILAVSFWMLGRMAERLWRLGQTETGPAAPSSGDADGGASPGQ